MSQTEAEGTDLEQWRMTKFATALVSKLETAHQTIINARRAHLPTMEAPCAPGCQTCGALWCPHGFPHHFEESGCASCRTHARQPKTELQPKTFGAILILQERVRQQEEEGYDPQADQGYRSGQLAWAAVHYAAPDPVLKATNVQQLVRERGIVAGDEPAGDLSQYTVWPWAKSWDKKAKHSRFRQLVIAGALICAEIDRLRAEGFR